VGAPPIVADTTQTKPSAGMPPHAAVPPTGTKR
jgi:hypothetical protein